MSSRRFFLKSTFAFVGVSSLSLIDVPKSIAPPISPSHYVFKVIMTAQGQDVRTYLNQRDWEDMAGFSQLNNEYKSQGKILFLGETVSSNRAEWVYIFDSEASFLDWDRTVRDNALHQPHSIPEFIHYSFDFNQNRSV